MSGGHFEYIQFRMTEPLLELKRLILENGKEGEYSFSPETIKEFRNAYTALQRAAIYLQRVDWLVSADDGEEDFHELLAEELAEIKKPEQPEVKE